jgi:hypothetical protein
VGKIVFAKDLETLEDVCRGAAPQVYSDQIKGRTARGIIEGADLTEHLGDRLVPLRDLEDEIDVERDLPGRHVNYRTFDPGGSSRSSVSRARLPAPEPASTIPFDSIPIMVVGWRLATTTTFRPTRSAGA